MNIYFLNTFSYYSLHSAPLCVSSKWRASWLDNPLPHKGFPLMFPDERVYFIKIFFKRRPHYHAFHVASASPLPPPRFSFQTPGRQKAPVKSFLGLATCWGPSGPWWTVPAARGFSPSTSASERRGPRSPATQVNPGQVGRVSQEPAGRVSTDGLRAAVRHLHRFPVENVFCAPFLPFLAPRQARGEKWRMFSALPSVGQSEGDEDPPSPVVHVLFLNQ